MYGAFPRSFFGFWLQNLKFKAKKFELLENQLLNVLNWGQPICFDSTHKQAAATARMSSETAPVSEPVYDYSDDVFDYWDGKKDLLIQTLTECILQTIFRVYESSGASGEGPIITV